MTKVYLVLYLTYHMRRIWKTHDEMVRFRRHRSIDQITLYGVHRRKDTIYLFLLQWSKHRSVAFCIPALTIGRPRVQCFCTYCCSRGTEYPMRPTAVDPSYGILPYTSTVPFIISLAVLLAIQHKRKALRIPSTPGSEGMISDLSPGHREGGLLLLVVVGLRKDRSHAYHTE